MQKTIYKIFFDVLNGQQDWLNHMAQEGFRLVKTGRLSYTFEPCEKGQYVYAVEYVGTQAFSITKDYLRYLDDLGYRTLTKNINADLSLLKVRWRPYAKGKGQIATSPGGYNRELIIVEKAADGQPFALHTDHQDRANALNQVKVSYIYAAFVMLLLMGLSFIPGVASINGLLLLLLRGVIGVLLIIYVMCAVRYSAYVRAAQEEGQIHQ